MSSQNQTPVVWWVVLSVSGLSKSFGSRQLFRDVTLQFSAGRRIALVGPNGAGKTTLLKIVVGLDEPDTGDVSRPKGAKVGYLPQELLETWHGTVVEEVLKGAGEVVELQEELNRLEAALSDMAQENYDKVIDDYGHVQSRFEQIGGYQVEAEAKRILGGLGFSASDMDRPLKEMSGGWQMRASLARLLLQKPDLLVLDEPTNHLDVESVTWLEGQLQNWPGALLFVSHDRDFIDAVAERVVEIAWGTANEYVGGFGDFVVAREEHLRILGATAARQAKEVARVEQFIERFRYKATKAKQVQSRVKTLEKLDRIELPTDQELKVKFAFPEPRRSARVAIEVEGADLGYDGVPLLRNVNLLVERGEKLALIGPNGAGKSTLLKAVLGDLKPIGGSVELGANVDIAYFAQHQVDALDLSKTVEQEFRTAAGEQPKTRNLRTVLGSFGFSGQAAERKVGDLSGGERTRLALAEAMCNPVNLLVLDEPTNHLDLPSCDILEDALAVYPGTVLLVSHDRHLIRNVAQQMVIVRDGAVKHYPEMDESLFTPAATEPKKSSNGGAGFKAKKVAKSVPAKPSRELRKRVDKLERKVVTAEEQVAELQQQLADPGVYSDADLMKQLLSTYGQAKDKAAGLLAEWELASEQLESIT